jgi:HK97 family phage prohead protease/HK97 family phage major capsid protein
MRYAVKSAPPPSGDRNEFVMSDNSLDRQGDVIEASGWDLSSFKPGQKFNPIALFNHRPDFVVGNWEKVRVKGNQLIGRFKPLDPGTSEIADSVRKMVEQDVLRAVSVGFEPIESEPLDKEKPYGGLRFKKQALLECSIVAVPANANAVAIARSMKLSSELADVIFRKPATENPVGPHGKPAAKSLEQSKGSKMSTATIAARIQAEQTNLNALRDALAELADKDQMDADETKRYDELPAQIEASKARIVKHRDAERSLLDDSGHTEPATVTRSSSSGNGQGNGNAALDGQILAPSPAPANERGTPGETIRIPAAPRKHLQFSDHQLRSLAAWAKAQAGHDPDIGRTLREMYPHGQNEITNMVLRAAVNPANTTVSTWAAELIQTDTMPFIDRLLAGSIFAPLKSMGVSYNFGNAGVLKIPVRANTPTLAGNWTAEGSPKPVRRASFTTVSLSPTKLSVISTFTEEMATYSAQSIEQIIRQAMSDDTSIALDTYLIDAVAASAGVRPAGLLNSVTPITASVLTPATAAMVADLKALIAAIVAAGGGRNIAIIINPAQALSLGFAQTTTGDFLFTDQQQAGSKFGVRFIVSATCAAGRVIAVDCADFAVAQGDTPRFAISTDATLHEEDTTPLAIGTAGAPATVAAPTRSLFQTDAVAIRMSLYVSWVMRRAGMVQTIASVSW